MRKGMAYSSHSSGILPDVLQDGKEAVCENVIFFGRMGQ
jgi:hypothetical protein